MSEQNKAFVRQYFQTFEQGDFDGLKELMHPDHRFRFPLAPEVLDRESHIQMSKGFFAAFSDFHFDILEQIAEGDKVVTRGVLHLRHTGEFQGIPPHQQRYCHPVPQHHAGVGRERRRGKG